MKKVLCILTILLGNVVVHAGGNELCEPTIVYKERIVYVDKIVEVPEEIIFVKNAKKNRLSLLLLNGPSDNVSLTTTPTSATIRHGAKNAVGAQFMRDLGRFNVLIQGDSNSNVGIGLGVNF